MIRRLSLSQRLALVFTSLLLLCAIAVCLIQLYSSAQYGNVMVQRLSAGLAQQIAAREPLLDAQGQVDRQMLKPLFDRLMTFNPSVELYLLSPDGELLADAAPPGHIKRQRIDLAPVQTFLSGGAWPVYGDDPRSLDKQKVFSVAPLRQDGQLRGYLYIILQGETFNWFWVTRPVRQLTALVATDSQDSIHAIKALAAQTPEANPGNEVAVLHNRFIELARQIASQWDRLADSDRQRREFVANISHDLRTPLTSLLGYLETLSLKADRLTMEENKQYLNIALRQGNKVRHLSQQLFELARLEHGGIKPQPETFVLAELVQDVAQKFDLPIATRNIGLRLELATGLPPITADLSMIERVLTNLLDNAIRHTPEGGLIRLAARRSGPEFIVEVADSGPGIGSELRATLFERPSVLAPGAQSASRGGLGLMIVRRMLQLHGGDIRLLDAPAGACFQFTLPV
ncbi:MAG: HAMP domain-containing sensor histidine kinase [Klebsiella grimontii]|nr:HAMP domain-containing sensor histidine kinase [Klebsiella grimontii]